MQIDRMELREKLARWADEVKARDEAMEAEKEAVAAPHDAERTELLRKNFAERKEMEQRHLAALRAIDERTSDVIDAIEARYDAMPEIDEPEGAGEVLTDRWFRPERCAKTGVVLLEDDEIVEDEETGEKFLRAALGLPPRETEEDEAEDDDDGTDLEDVVAA